MAVKINNHFQIITDRYLPLQLCRPKGNFGSKKKCYREEKDIKALECLSAIVDSRGQIFIGLRQTFTCAMILVSTLALRLLKNRLSEFINLRKED